MRLRTLITALLVSLALLAGGCGQKGPLYLPQPEEPAPSGPDNTGP